jgi:putative transposase
VPAKKRKKRLTGVGTHVGAMSPIVPNALWALDFQFDATIDGHQVKLLNVIDEFTRECLTLAAEALGFETLLIQHGGRCTRPGRW